MVVRCSSICAAVAALAMIAPAASAASSLTWRLENPFRLFRHTADFERLRVPAGMTMQQWFTRIAPQVKGDFLPYRRTWWDPAGSENTTGQYEPGYVRPTHHRIVLGWHDAPAGAQCEWRVGGQAPRQAPCASTTAEIPYDHARPAQATTVSVRAGDDSGASTTVTIRDWLILGLGDSYSSGEGSPDRPAELGLQAATQINDPFLPQETRGIRRVWFPLIKAVRPVEWWDNECHRSLLSWQAMAALKLASELTAEAERQGSAERHAVTFASYACSGAEFYDGVFTPQANPPGVLKRYADADETYRAPASVQHSQLAAAGRDLCDGGQPLRAFHGARRLDMHGCAAPRRPDAVLLSVGGNDAGFARAIMHKVLPLPEDGNSEPGAKALGWMHGLLGTVDADAARQRMLVMAGHYAPLSQALETTLHVPRDGVVLMAYPNSIMRPDALRKNGAGDYCGLEMRAGMEAARERASPPAKFWWHFWPTQAEMENAGTEIVIKLQETIKGALPPGWRYADGHLAAFQQHGMCADAAVAEADSAKQPTQASRENVLIYGLPRQTVNENRRVEPLESLNWHAYDNARQRWVRTPNDSLLTQTHSSLRKSITGAFHPTGAGYAAMADAAYAELARLVNARREASR